MLLFGMSYICLQIFQLIGISHTHFLSYNPNYFSWVVVRYGIGETLVKFDDTMKAKPWLALKWSVSEDGKTWTLAESGWTDTNGDGIVDKSATIFLGYPKINMIGKSYLKGIHTSPSEYYVITKDLKKE